MRTWSKLALLALALGLYSLPALADWHTATVATGNDVVNMAVDPMRNRVFTANNLSGTSGTVTVVNCLTNQVQNWVAGAQPRCLAVNPITGKLYVAINGSPTNDTVVVFDTTGTIIRKLPVKREPYSMVVDPEYDRLYVANYDSDTISIFASDTLWLSYPVRNAPYSLTLNPVNHALFIRYISGDTISTLNLGWYSLMHLRSGHLAQGIAINASVNKAYVTNTNEDSVTVFDCAGTLPVFLKKISVGDGPISVVSDPGAKRVYVGNFVGGTVTAIDCSTNTAVQTVAAGSYPQNMAMNPGTGKLYVGNHNSHNDLRVLDWRSGGAQDSIILSHPSRQVAVNALTNTIYASMDAGATDSLAVIDGADHELTITDTKTNSEPSVAVNPITGDAFFANSSSDNVTVIKNNGDTLTIPVGDCPRRVVVNPMTNKVFVLNYNEKSVSVIDGASYAVERTLPADSTSASLDINPLTNYIYIGGGGGSYRIRVIDGKDWDTTSILIGYDPSLVKVNPATNRIYVGSSLGAKLYVVDGARHQVIDTVPAGSQLHDIAVNPLTNKIYCANWGDDNVTVINGADNSAVNVAVGDAPAKVAVNAALNKIYVSNFYGNTVTEIDGATNATNTIPVQAWPLGIAADPVTGKVFVCNSNTSTATIIDCASRDTMSLVVSNGPQDVAVDPARGKVFVATRSFKAGIIDQTVERDTRVTTYDGGTTWAHVFPGATQNRTVLSVNHWRPYRTQLKRGFFSLSGQQSFWKFGTNSSSTDSSLSWNTGDYWGADTAIFGENIYRRGALEIQAATTNNLGGGTPFVSNIATDVMYRLDYPDGPIIAWWDSLPDDNDSTNGYGPYTVRAALSDFSGIDSGQLYYEIDAVSQPRIKMTRAQGDTFAAVIPAIAVPAGESRHIAYNIHVWDHAHNPYSTANYRSVSARYFWLRNLTGVEGEPAGSGLPMTFALQAAYPSPVQARTSIGYQLPKAATVTLEIYNLAGQVVKRFDQGVKQPGYHSVRWDVSKESAGVYFYRLKAGEWQATRKMVVIK